jgi:hypothetical protein
MDHWKRSLIPNGFEWTSDVTGTCASLQVKDRRWTATVSVLLGSGDRESASFFVEDGYYASLEKCLLFVWRSLILTDKSTFDLEEALEDLRRYAR